jgi:hypothetical protein
MSLWWMPAGSRISFSAVRRASSAATRGDQAAWPRHQAHGATSVAASACVACIVPSSWFANQQKMRLLLLLLIPGHVKAVTAAATATTYCCGRCLASAH